jgi:exopolysaccharide production protein ExoY
MRFRGATVPTLFQLLRSAIVERAHPIIVRFFDLVVAVFLTTLLMPLIAMIAFAGFCIVGRNIIVQEICIGQNNQLFPKMRFRTRSIEAFDLTSAVKGARRSQRMIDPEQFGRVLDELRLAELPQLINLMRGDMSIFGPSPQPWPPRRRVRLASAAAAARPGLSHLFT